MMQAMEVLDSRLDDAARKQMPYPEMLADLLGVEVSARRERYLTTRTRLAHLPFRRNLEEFDFSFQPSIEERQVKELATLAFVAEASNLLLLGPPRSGQDAPGGGAGSEVDRERLRGLLRAGLRPDGGPEKGES